MDLPNTETPVPPDAPAAGLDADEANPALVGLAEKLGIPPQRLGLLIRLGRTAGELLGLEDSGKLAGADHPDGAIHFAEPEPWPEPVRAGELLGRITHAIGFHVRMDRHLVLVAALWAVHTHALPRFTRTPRLVIHSGRVASGKTTLLSVLSCLVLRPLTICAATPKSLLEIIGHRPTLLIDEASALLQANREARALIRNGCSRSGARLLRMGRGSLHATSRAEAIQLFTPVAAAVDGDIPQIFAGRAIGIPLEPLKSGETAGALSPEAIENLSQMRRMIARWVADGDDTPGDAAPLAESHDPNWQPLIGIAAAIGDEWATRATDAMKLLRGSSPTSELERLLRDIRTVIREIGSGQRQFTGPDGKIIGDHDRIRTIDLIERLCAAEFCRWQEHGRNGQPITPHALARILAEANIRPGALRFHTGDENGSGSAFSDRGYLFTQFAQAFERYLPCHIAEQL